MKLASVILATGYLLLSIPFISAAETEKTTYFSWKPTVEEQSTVNNLSSEFAMHPTSRSPKKEKIAKWKDELLKKLEQIEHDSTEKVYLLKGIYQILNEESPEKKDKGADENNVLLERIKSKILLCAISYKQEDLIDYVLKEKTRRCSLDGEALILGASKGNLKVCTLLINKPFTVIPHHKHSEALIRAAEEGFPKVCELLLNASDSPAIASFHSSKALRLAAANGHLKVCEILLNCPKPARADAKDSDALMCAIKSKKDQTSICKCLLHTTLNPAKANAQDSLALLLAVRQGNKELVELLLNMKTNKARANARHGAALTEAASLGDVELCEILLNPQLTDHANADANNSLALVMAAARGYGEVCQLLLLQKRNPAHVSADHYAPLIAALKNNNQQICDLFLAHEQKMNRQIPPDIFSQAFQEAQDLEEEY